MTHRVTIRALLLAFAASLATAASVPAPPEFQEVRQFVEQSIAKGPSPSAAIVVVRDDRVVWAEGFGYADIEAKRKSTPDTSYWLASVSKPFTATALMTLVERGLVDLDRPANDYLPGAKLRTYEGDAREMTIRRLANHTSGMPTHFNFFHDGVEPPSWDETIRRYGFAFTRPGTRVEYSNLAFGLLGYITEVVSKKPRSEFLDRTVFRPLKLTHTSDHPRAEESAVPYWMDSAGRPVRIRPYTFDHPAASAYWSSANDLARFVRMHMHDGELDGVRIIKPESAIAMRTPRGDVREPGPLRFGIAWGVERFMGHDCVAHTGGMPGVSNSVRVFPKERGAVIVLTNSDDRRLVGEMATRIGQALLNEAPPARRTVSTPAPPKASEELIGTWMGAVDRYDGSVPVRLTVQQSGAVELALGDRPAVTLRDVAFGKGYLTGIMEAAVLKTREDFHGAAPLQVRLWLEDGKLNGFAMSWEVGYFGLSQHMALKRM